MARGLKKGQSHSGSWKKGVSGNPTGRKKLSESEKELRTTRGPLYAKIIAEVLEMKYLDFEKLIAKIQSGKIPKDMNMLQFKLIHLLPNADIHFVDRLLDRVIGRSFQRSEIDLQADISIDQRILIDEMRKLSKNELVKIARKAAGLNQ